MKIVLLSAQTLRSYAYSVVLGRHDHCQVSVVEYDINRKPASRIFPRASSAEWDPLPIWLRTGWREEYFDFRNRNPGVGLDAELNDPAVANAVTALSPDLVIYAGAAGNIVGEHLLSGAPFLHVHPGSVPRYRGSTTIYWSLLEGSPVTVSAIYLSEQIDQGQLVAAMEAPNPTPSSDIDGLYDSGIRALLLDKVLEGNTALPTSINQAGPGRDYYVIHPVLKNIVLSRIAPGR